MADEIRNDAHVNLRLPSAMAAELRALAERRERSLGAEIRAACAGHLAGAATARELLDGKFDGGYR